VRENAGELHEIPVKEDAFMGSAVLKKAREAAARG
jgi:hypothetical protein